MIFLEALAAVGRLAVHRLTLAAAVLAIYSTIVATPVAAQQQKLVSSRAGEEPYVLTFLPPGAIILDGRIDEAAWEKIEALPVFEHTPAFGAPPSERTEFRIAYDSEYFYFACHSYDSDVRGIRAYSMERDESGFRSDFCSIYIDTLNDEENALSFRVGPMGNRADSQRSNDAQQNNPSWDAFWDAATSRDENGWYAEFRIPFTTMLFQAINGRVVMGMSMLRNISRKGETHVHPAMPPDPGTFSYAMSSRMRKVVFEQLRPRGAPIYVTPYALTGGGYTTGLNPLRTAYDGNAERVLEAGGDLRYGVTSNLTLQLTANTDFAQVEADDQQVNLTRFSLFFPEKRDFFQERTSNFEYSLGGQERLFHSRTIGLAAGEPVRIYGGGRLVGRVGDWDLGILDLQTAAATTLPSENLGVARVRRRVLNSNSYVGGILTSRLGTEGQRNVVAGADGIFRVVGRDYLVLNFAQSFDSDEPATATYGPFDRAVARVNWERRQVQGLGYRFDLMRTGKIFEPGMGFLQRRNYTTGQGSVGYGWRSRPGALLNTYGVQLDGAAFRRNSDGTIETVEVGPTASLATWSQHSLSLEIPFRYENLNSAFSLPEQTWVPAGTYRFVTPQLQYTGPAGALFRTTATLTGGSFYDGHEIAASVGPIWDPSAHLNLSAAYQIDRVSFPERAQGFTSHIGRFRTSIMLSTRTSVVGFIQYNSTGNGISTNIRIRYNPREGNDLYLVWNEGLVTDRRSFDPVRPLTSSRTVLIKYSRTLRFAT